MLLLTAGIQRVNPVIAESPRMDKLLSFQVFTVASRWFFFGDSESDLQAAKASSIHGIAVSPGDLFKQVEHWIENDYYKSPPQN